MSGTGDDAHNADVQASLERTEKYTIRLTKDEKQRLQQAAEAVNMKPAAYVRDRVFVDGYNIETAKERARRNVEREFDGEDADARDAIAALHHDFDDVKAMCHWLANGANGAMKLVNQNSYKGGNPIMQEYLIDMTASNGLMMAKLLMAFKHQLYTGQRQEVAGFDELLEIVERYDFEGYVSYIQQAAQCEADQKREEEERRAKQKRDEEEINLIKRAAKTNAANYAAKQQLGRA